MDSEEVGVAMEVKSSQDIQLTYNEAYGPILKGTAIHCPWTSGLVTLQDL